MKIFRWDDKIPIRFMRFEYCNRLYAFICQRNNEIQFKAVPKGGYRGSARMLTAWRAKHKISQVEAARRLHVSQSAIAKYEEGIRTMPLRVALIVEDTNNGRLLGKSEQKTLTDEKIFTPGRIHVFSFRILVGGKFYACQVHNRDELIFGAVPAPEPNQWGRNLVKAFRKKYHFTQSDAAKALRVSKSMIQKYESGERVLREPQLNVVRLMVRHSIEELKQLQALRKQHPIG